MDLCTILCITHNRVLPRTSDFFDYGNEGGTTEENNLSCGHVCCQSSLRDSWASHTVLVPVCSSLRELCPFNSDSLLRKLDCSSFAWVPKPCQELEKESWPLSCGSHMNSAMAVLGWSHVNTLCCIADCRHSVLLFLGLFFSGHLCLGSAGYGDQSKEGDFPTVPEEELLNWGLS